MRGEGKIQIGFGAGLQLGQSNPVKAFNTKQDRWKESRYLEILDNMNAEYSSR
jgi:hypothetical protein